MSYLIISKGTSYGPSPSQDKVIRSPFWSLVRPCSFMPKHTPFRYVVLYGHASTTTCPLTSRTNTRQANSCTIILPRLLQHATRLISNVDLRHYAKWGLISGLWCGRIHDFARPMNDKCQLSKTS